MGSNHPSRFIKMSNYRANSKLIKKSGILYPRLFSALLILHYNVRNGNLYLDTVQLTKCLQYLVGH